VPFPPPPPRPEHLPPKPDDDAVWVDGEWDWDGTRYRWVRGSWVKPPAGAKVAPWSVVRRGDDGQLFYSPSTWYDASGRAMPAPEALARGFVREPRDGGAPAEMNAAATQADSGSPESAETPQEQGR